MVVKAADGGGRSVTTAKPDKAGSDSSKKQQMIDLNPPKGTRDFPPEEMRVRNWLFDHFREVAKQFGFEVRRRRRRRLNTPA